MSFVGIRGLPMLKHPLSKSPLHDDPSSQSRASSPSSVELSHDSKEVLIERLGDLTERLSRVELAEDDISVLHIHMHRMERVLRGKKLELRTPLLEERRSSFGRRTSALSTQDEDIFWGPPSPIGSPPRRTTLGFSQSPPGTPRQQSRSLLSSHHRLGEVIAQMPNKEILRFDDKVEILAGEAETVFGRLSSTLEELKTRKAETDTIQGLLLDQCECNVERIAFLENQIREINEDHDSLLAKLSFLRIQLRALEVQGADHIPFNADEELSTSIRNWKLEWAEVDMKTRKSKKRCEDVFESPKLRPVRVAIPAQASVHSSELDDFF